MNKNITELYDPFAYVVADDDDKIIAVRWHRENNYVRFDRDGTVSFAGSEKNIDNHELKQLMIMWLALEHPKCLDFDATEDMGETVRE